MSKGVLPDGARVLAAGRFLTFIDDHGWEYVTRPGVDGIVVIVAFTDEGKLLLVEQPRPAVRRHVIELPAGLAGDGAGRSGEALAEAASRELVEETGYEAAEIVLLAEGPTAVGVSDETVSFFHARRLRRVGPGGGDDTEQITVHEVALPDLPAFLADGRRRGLAVDAKIYAGLYLVGAAAPGQRQP
jgi:ADP-ribose pyrophosphatase